MLAAALVLGAAPAFGDGDPASDVLVQDDAFYPYSPVVATGLRTRLNGLLKDARRHKHPFKVALIQSPGDLGAYPDLFRKPQKYAELLHSEITFGHPAHVLVVMPNGFGGKDLPKGWKTALHAIEVDSGKKSDGLAGAAIRAIPKLSSLAARQG